MATSETEKLQETIDELKERIERLEKENAKLKGETSWEPKRDEKYFALDGGKISEYLNIDQDRTDLAIAAGNCFRTKKRGRGVPHMAQSSQDTPRRHQGLQARLGGRRHG